MSIKTQQVASKIASKQAQHRHVYITDRKFISKIINDFINNNQEATNVKRPTTSAHYYNRQDIIKALTNLQMTYKSEFIPGQKVNINTDHFKIALLNSMAKLHKVAIPKSMNQIDGRTIDFVEMIFGTFLRDKNISNVVKTLLLRLQIPVIKTSLLEKNFFYNDQHPARLVLNTIAHLGIGVENKENSLYKTMDLIIEQLLRSFGVKTISFATALASLSRLTSIENKKQNSNEQLIKSKITQELARQAVLTELQYYTKDVSIPTPVQPLILKHWSTLMCHRYMQHGGESDSWKEATGILKHLTRSFIPIGNKDEWLSLKCHYVGTIATVKALLSGSNQNKEKIFLAVRNLNNTYQKILEKYSIYEEEAINSLILGESSSENVKYNGVHHEEARPEDTKTILAKKLINNLPEIVRPNVWFEIFNGVDKPIRRLKLSVIVQENAKLVFVDRRGIKTLEKDAHDFTKELENNQSRLIDDYDVFDHALSKVIGCIVKK